jgi:CheY-like chemotaxis protein
MTKRILLIDDDSSVRRSLSLGLNQLGYDVEPCDSGFKALNKLDLYTKNLVNLDSVVVDVNLPDINGIKLGKIIRSKYPDSAIMYITGYADKLDLSDIEDLKKEGLLEKPFTADDLIIEINKILGKQFKAPKPEIVEKEKIKPSSAYVLIKIKKDTDYFSLFRKLYFMDNVVYCDATKGDIDIILLLQSDSIDGCIEVYENNIKNIKDIQDARFLPVSIPVLNDNIKEIVNLVGISLFEDMHGMSKIRDSHKSVCSYILLNVDREKLDNVYPILKLTDNILYCDYAEGSYNLILMVRNSAKLIK